MRRWCPGLSCCCHSSSAAMTPPSHPIQNTDYIVSSHWRCGGGPITETSPHNVQLESALIRLQPLISSIEAHWSHIAVCRCWCSCAACPRVTREIDAVMTSCRVRCHVSRVTWPRCTAHCINIHAPGWRWGGGGGAGHDCLAPVTSSQHGASHWSQSLPCPAVAVIIFIFTVVTMQCGDVEMLRWPQLLVTAHLLLNIQAHGVGGALAEDGRLSTVSTQLQYPAVHSCSW